MTSNLWGKVYTFKDLTTIVDKMISDGLIDSDLSHGNFCMPFSSKENMLYLHCEGPFFGQEIEETLFKKYAKNIGHLPICKNCQYFKLLKNTKESWGTCNWFDTHNPVVPFWADFDTKYGSISQEQSGCEVFMLEDSL